MFQSNEYVTNILFDLSNKLITTCIKNNIYTTFDHELDSCFLVLSQIYLCKYGNIKKAQLCIKMCKIYGNKTRQEKNNDFERMTFAQIYQKTKFDTAYSLGNFEQCKKMYQNEKNNMDNVDLYTLTVIF